MSEIYALYGKSGTGKSHRAISIAYKYNIPLIIDDGLLIYKGKRIDGSVSGKQEKNKIKAVKRAIFDNKDYAKQMKEKINKTNPDKILIIGTSKNMINKIVKHLELNSPGHWIDINTITTTQERIRAKNHRSRGRHVVPLSPVEVRKNFRVPLLDQLKLMITSKGSTKYLGEQSVVKPEFHSLGGVFIKEKALQDMTFFTLQQQINLNNIKNIKITSTESNTLIEVQVSLNLDVPFHVLGDKLKNVLKHTLTNLTGLDNLQVKMIISEVDFSKEKPQISSSGI
ncbi:isopentenyl transferase family protein [Natranaerobius trueperi]|uniref:Asp23/Gls24 family envelope stress response protein n=1 Tax=Natranaerobius trueperi TaxID=759412 RepID=A0A226C2W2_9FIRM|nr:isopentenyl transferase family protein [Natranaerobius trueperi]OWZ84789.1 hypothetical protein CDO51_01870 [Natranaerobius trueperi]